MQRVSMQQHCCSSSGEHRSGDHIWYVSDVSKFQTHYPAWEYTYDMDNILEELVEVISKRRC